MPARGSVKQVITALTVLLSVPYSYADPAAPEPASLQASQVIEISLPEINYKNCSDSGFLNSLFNTLANASASNFSKEQLQDIHAFTDKCLLILKQN